MSLRRPHEVWLALSPYSQQLTQLASREWDITGRTIDGNGEPRRQQERVQNRDFKRCETAIFVKTVPKNHFRFFPKGLWAGRQLRGGGVPSHGLPPPLDHPQKRGDGMGGGEAKFCNKKCVFMLEAKGNGLFLTKVPILLFSPRHV